jgi:uncharacterized protein (TIGR02391 family)
MAKQFSRSQLQAIADALGDTSEGLTGSEIAHLLAACRIPDTSPEITKRHRLFNAFASHQNAQQNRIPILAFIRYSMKPETYVRTPERFEPMRARLNRALLFAGLQVEANGSLVSADAADTISEAERRARELRTDMETLGIHPEVLRFCRDELMADNYFHAVLEAVKSIADRLREKTGLGSDGAVLVDQVLGGDPPLVCINGWANETDRSEQRGFAHLVKGIFGMFRNTTAHAPKIAWAVDKSSAEEALSLVSLVHRRLDTTIMPPRVSPSAT